jgi:hypothetical protein
MDTQLQAAGAAGAVRQHKGKQEEKNEDAVGENAFFRGIFFTATVEVGSSDLSLRGQTAAGRRQEAAAGKDACQQTASSATPAGVLALPFSNM